MKPWQYVILIVVGIAVVVLIGYALKPFFLDRPDVYMWWKILMGIIIVGFVGLLEYVIIDRIRSKKKEPKRIKKAKH